MGRRTEAKNRWALILAAGQGKRLAGLTMADGEHVPKQFCALMGQRSLLATTLARAERLVPRDRILVVVAEQHERWWRPELAGLPVANVLVQPADRGTAPGLLLPLLAILERDGQAQVLVLPSDHHLEREEVFLRTASQALAEARRSPDGVFLLGVTPDAADPELGWIVPGGVARRRPGRSAVWSVDGFVEKPGPDTAGRLFAAGASWNSFVLAATALALLRLYQRRAPELLTHLGRAFGARNAARPERLTRAYAELARVDFSRDLLQGSESSLRLLRVPACGWSDLGTPERLFACRAKARAESPLPRARDTLSNPFGARSIELALG